MTPNARQQVGKGREKDEVKTGCLWSSFTLSAEMERIQRGHIKGRLNLDRSMSTVCVLVAQSCLTLCNPMDWSLPGSSVHGILQARILEWVAIPHSRGSSQPRDQTQVSGIAGRFVTVWATREALWVLCVSPMHQHRTNGKRLESVNRGQGSASRLRISVTLDSMEHLGCKMRLLIP